MRRLTRHLNIEPTRTFHLPTQEKEFKAEIRRRKDSFKENSDEIMFTISERQEKIATLGNS